MSEDFSPPLRFPFLIGVYMATNAVPDAYTVVDGPDCLFFKTEFIHGKHDIRSTLLDVFGRHRIALSNVNAGNVAKSKGESVRRKIQQIDSRGDAGLIAISSLPMVTIIGTQYDTIIRELQPTTRARLVDCPNRSLQGDWLTGYSDFLIALAAQMDVSGGRLDPRKVAVVGNLMDRTEFDHLANVAELERLVGGLGLELSTVWLGGQPYKQLAEIKNAGTILAFPLGMKAAKILAKRTGAKVVEVDVPFGLGRTRKMLVKLAKATGRLTAAEPFIDSELGAVVPRVEWVVPHVFLGRKLAFSAPPDLLGGFVEIAQDLGARVVHLSAYCWKGHMAEELDSQFTGLPAVLFEPKAQALQAESERLMGIGADLVVANNDLYNWMRALGAPLMEFGFPSNHTHALTDRPFLGFRGWLCFVERMANALTARNIKAPNMWAAHQPAGRDSAPAPSPQVAR
jgi:nitrogenase molybdenum-iron protein alpha/beta subunit